MKSLRSGMKRKPKDRAQQAFDLAVIDLQLANQDGISLMEEIHLMSPDLPVIILTAHGSIESAVEAMKRGAYTYLTKPFDARELTCTWTGRWKIGGSPLKSTGLRACWGSAMISKTLWREAK